MNIAQLLNYGPRIVSNPISQRAKEKVYKRYTQQMIDSYKSFSVDNTIWCTLVAQKTGAMATTASKNLLEISKDGLLIPIGKHKDSKSSNKPILYRWK